MEDWDKCQISSLVKYRQNQILPGQKPSRAYLCRWTKKTLSFLQEWHKKKLINFTKACNSSFIDIIIYTFYFSWNLFCIAIIIHLALNCEIIYFRGHIILWFCIRDFFIDIFVDLYLNQYKKVFESLFIGTVDFKCPHIY